MLMDYLKHHFLLVWVVDLRIRQEGSPRAQEFMEQDEDVEDLEVSDDDIRFRIR